MAKADLKTHILSRNHRDFSMDSFIYYSSAGALTGFVVGLTGIGGGALMTPILLLIFGVAPTTAVATDLWFATITKLAAVLIHHREKQVDWQIVHRLWLGSLPVAFLVSMMLLAGTLVSFNAKYLTSFIGVAILMTGVSFPLSHWLRTHHRFFKSSQSHIAQKLELPLTISAGMCLGLLVSLTSVGAGALGSVILFYLYPTRLTPNKLIGTDIAHAIPLALAAGLGYLIAGKVDMHLLFSLVLGSVPAAILGSMVAMKFSHRHLRLCLMAILSVSGLKLIF
jgi:uncharacterized membrane protein YfcA